MVYTKICQHSKGESVKMSTRLELELHMFGAAYI